MIYKIIFELEVKLTSPAFIWFQQEKNHHFLHSNFFAGKKSDLNTKLRSESRCGRLND